MLCDNPCRRVFIPKQEQDEKQIYTLEEVAMLFDNLGSEPLKYKVFLLLAIYTGFRRSEMLGLEWKDIDFENELIHVRRTSQYTSAKGIYTDTTKTKNSKRVSKMPTSIMDMLRRFKAEQESEAERLGTKWEDHDRLFTKWNGLPMNPQTPYGWFREFCEKHDFRFCNIHSMRHSHASILIAAGVDVATVSADLGHSNCNTTLGIYTHEFAMQKARTSDIIGQSINFQIKKEQRDCL